MDDFREIPGKMVHVGSITGAKCEIALAVRANYVISCAVTDREDKIWPVSFVTRIGAALGGKMSKLKLTALHSAEKEAELPAEAGSE